MIGYWHAMAPDEAYAVQVSLRAQLVGHDLIVERCGGEPCWHWAVLSHMGHEIEGGIAQDAHAAERMAEEAAFHIHPPSIGDWVGRLI